MEAQKVNITSARYFQTLKIMSLAFILAVVFAIIVNTGIILMAKMSFTPDLKNILMYFSLIVTILAIVSSFFIYSKKIEQTKAITVLTKKMASYRTAFVLKNAILEGSSFFSIVFLLLTGDFIFIAFAVIPVGIIVFYFPSKEKIIKELDIKGADLDTVNDPNGIVLETYVVTNNY